MHEKRQLLAWWNMNQRVYALFGMAGPLVAYISIGISIALSPWFSWQTSALSDLGHAVKSEVAPIFNLGQLLAGLLVMIYIVAAFRKHAKYTSVFLAVSSFSLQLIAVFDEVYGLLHFAVSVLFFASLGFASVMYSWEKRSNLAVVAFIVIVASWLLYWAQAYSAGAAVPELISSLAAAAWIVRSAIGIYLNK